MVRQHDLLTRHEFQETLGDSGGQKAGMLQSMGPQRVRHDLVPRNKNNNEAGVELMSGQKCQSSLFPSILYYLQDRYPFQSIFTLILAGRGDTIIKKGGVLLVRLIPCTTELLTSEILTKVVKQNCISSVSRRLCLHFHLVMGKI